MEDWIDIQKNDKQVARERAKARDLKKSAWWQSVLQRGICHYCNRHFPPDQLTMDHIVPVVRGGKSTRGNVVAACLECNQKKKYLTPVEMLMQELEAKNDPPEGED